MKLIVLKGTGKTGKTSTLKNLKKLIEKENKIVGQEITDKIVKKVDEKDIICYFENVCGLKVGIISGGDDQEYIKDAIKYFEKNYSNIDILFCVDRSYRKDENYIEKLKYEKTIIGKSYIQEVDNIFNKEEMCDENNNETAKYLYKLLKKYI